jgi:glycosyltransferase involved in cell wall biosynthesis
VRVLYLNHTSRVSGGELSLLALLKGLPDSVDALVACPPGDLVDRVGEANVDVKSITGTDASLSPHPVRTPRALAEMARAAVEVRKLVSHTDAEVLHANSIRAGLVAVAAGRGRVPVVAHVRDCLPSGPLSAATRTVLARADALIANSNYTKSALGRAGRRARVIYNPVDLSQFDGPGLRRQEARDRLGLGEGPVLTVIAQITPWKGQVDAIEAAAELASEFPDLRLLLVGSAKFDSPSTRYDNQRYLRQLHQLVAARSLEEAVVFTGERRDIPQVLAATDIVLAPSWEEPFGRSIVEAMAAAVPVLATDIGGPPEILGPGDDGPGMVLPPKQPKAWAERIRALLRNPDQLSEMGRAGAHTAREHFGIERHAKEVLCLYEELTSARNRR